MRGTPRLQEWGVETAASIGEKASHVSAVATVMRTMVGTLLPGSSVHEPPQVLCTVHLRRAAVRLCYGAGIAAEVPYRQRPRRFGEVLPRARLLLRLHFFEPLPNFFEPLPRAMRCLLGLMASAALGMRTSRTPSL